MFSAAHRTGSFPRAYTPRRVLRSHQGNADVIMNLDEGSTSFIVALGQASDRFSILKCKDKRCETCKSFNLSKTIKSNVTYRKYEVIKLPGENLTCHSQNILYLMSCMSCNIQNVGVTAIQFHLRMDGHRTAKEGCEHEIRHCKETYNSYNFEYQILEKYPEMTKIRKAHEDIWIKRLRTIYPYGLNENASGKPTDSSKIELAVGKLYIFTSSSTWGETFSG